MATLIANFNTYPLTQFFHDFESLKSFEGNRLDEISTQLHNPELLMSVLHANWLIYIFMWLAFNNILKRFAFELKRPCYLGNFQTLLLPYVHVHSPNYRTQWFDKIYFHAQTAACRDTGLWKIGNLGSVFASCRPAVIKRDFFIFNKISFSQKSKNFVKSDHNYLIMVATKRKFQNQTSSSQATFQNPDGMK